MSRARNGGFPARRAVVRWAWRLFRREWRQQLLVLALLTVAVAAAVIGVSAGYNLAPLDEARFGTAGHLLRYDGSDPQALEAKVTAARDWFGTIEVIGHRYAPIPGSVETVELRAQDPHGPYGAPMLLLRDGRYPAAAGEIAVTDGIAATLRRGVGERVVLAGLDWSVVGLVENPSDLGAEFALVPPAHAGPAESVTVLVNATPDGFAGFRDAHGTPPVFESRRISGQAVAAVGVFGFVTVGLLLVCLVAAAGFAVLAQRRLRQLGLLGAIGATERHLRLVLLASGAVVGAVSAVAGSAAGLALWIAVASEVETAAGHRIDRLSLPWWLILAAVVLAIGMSTAAAWRPARTAARIPVILALSARPPRPKPARRSALAAGLFLGAGVVCLVLARQSRPLLVVGGTLATGLGILFISSMAVRAAAGASARLPVAARLALRDLARHQARSGAALAAISLALAIPVAIVITASAAQYTADEGNLSDRQLVVRVGGQNDPLIPDHSPAQLASLETQVRRFTATLDNPTVISLDGAVDAAARAEHGFDGGEGGRPAVELGVPIADEQYNSLPLYVATAELLGYYGVDAGAVDPAIDILTTRARGDLEFVNIRARHARVEAAPLADPGYSSMPSALITPAAMRRNGWTPARAGWLIEAGRPLSTAQVANARDMAIDAGLTVESRHDQTSLLVLRSGATAAGGLLALGVLALTVGLIRGESAGDLRTLTATGATSGIRRSLTATTAGGLALLGAIVGIAGAYIALAAAYADDIGALSRVPVVHLTITAVGVPLVAAASGWLLAGREPTSLTRPRLE